MDGLFMDFNYSSSHLFLRCCNVHCLWVEKLKFESLAEYFIYSSISVENRQEQCWFPSWKLCKDLPSWTWKEGRALSCPLLSLLSETSHLIG